MNDLQYQSGFGNEFATESLNGALPVGQNSPQKVAYGLYAEQLTGSAFTAPRGENKRTWLYRIFPSVVQSKYERINNGNIVGTDFDPNNANPNQFRWDPLEYPKTPTDFSQSWVTYAGNGSINGQSGCAIHLFSCNKDMNERFFYSADGELLVVPCEGTMIVKTELGILQIEPTEFFVIPRGIKFSISLPEKKARGYICENFGTPFRLPGLGPIGANGLANPRDFLYPVSAYEDQSGDYEIIGKFNGNLWSYHVDHSPADVVAWHGNYAPYKYDLKCFNTINTVSFDHPDPSIFTVLTSPSAEEGVANLDFVCFAPRWMVAQDTFRPPYFHRNIMSEFMGLILGKYDAKEEGFVPGGASLHNCMSSHGPDSDTFEKASNSDLVPEYQSETYAFMFESRYPFVSTKQSLQSPHLQKNYPQCWQGLKRHFNPSKQ
jgi:homogentisate 1,2-dioxygenase